MPRKFAEPRRVGVGEAGRADVAHHDEGAREELFVGRAHEVVIGRPVPRLADPCTRELPEANAQVALAERVIRAPADAVPPHLGVDEPADDEVPVRKLRRRE